jgi:hypothetical protein
MAAFIAATRVPDIDTSPITAAANGSVKGWSKWSSSSGGFNALNKAKADNTIGTIGTHLRGMVMTITAIRIVISANAVGTITNNRP